MSSLKSSRRLSARLRHWSAINTSAEQRRFDVIVIGSGYGGAVAALRLSEKGYKVLVLERGSEFLPGDFPSDVSMLPTFSRFNRPDKPSILGRSAGAMNWHAGPGIASLVGNGLGGGSLINAGVMIQPTSEVFGQACWPNPIALDQPETGMSLSDAFASAREMLMSRPGEPALNSRVDASPYGKARALGELATALQIKERLKGVDVTIDASKCTACGDCATGCNIPGAKLTLSETYLAKAVQAGAQILCGATVMALKCGTETSWSVFSYPTERADLESDPLSLKLHEIELQADQVVLAAGTFGSTEILQRSRERYLLALSSALGTGLSANGDSISVVANWSGGNGPVNAVSRPRPHNVSTSIAPIGPTITGSIDLRHGGPIKTQLLIQEGAVPAAISRLFDHLISTQWIGAQMNTWGNCELINDAQSSDGKRSKSDPLGAPSSLGDQSQVLLVMGHDDAQGRILWRPEINRSIPVWSEPEKETTWQTQQALFNEIEKTIPCVRHLHTPLWRLLPEAASVMQGAAPAPVITTVHPLGGCVMGDSFEHSVVDDRGRVRSSLTSFHHGLYVLDGSIVPGSLGCNPLLTITALAERAMSFVAPASAPLSGEPSIMSTAKMAVLQTEAQTASVEPLALSTEHNPGIGAVCYERLLCEQLPLSDQFAADLGTTQAFAEAEIVLGFAHYDWDYAMASAEHKLAEISGHLKLRTPDSPLAQRYRLEADAASAAPSRFVVLSEYAVNDGLNHWSRRIGRLGLTALTWLVVRGIPDSRRSRALSERSAAARWYRKISHASMLRPSALHKFARLLWHTSEARQMEYRLRFVHDKTLDLRSEHEQPHEPVLTSAVPPVIWLHGFKHVQYAATPREWWNWLIDRTPRLLGRLQGKPTEQNRPPLKRTYIEQICNPTITLYGRPMATESFFSRLGRPKNPPLATGAFIMDPYALLQEKPPQLHDTGDLSQALQTLAGYPALFARFALKTRLFDFRAPDYSNRVYRDNAPAEETRLRWRDNKNTIRFVAPEALTVTVKRGVHASEDPELAGQEIKLRLWRYRRVNNAPDGTALPDWAPGTWKGQPVRRVRSVLLMHAFSQSGYCYTVKTTKQNLAEALLAAGYEVWILESRMSTRLPISHIGCSVDQIARYDVPAAVREILDTLEADFSAAQVPADHQHLQINCFAQCIGAASTTMSLLSGHLHHPAAKGQRPVPMLASLMLSQVHPLIVGDRGSQARSWIPPLLRLGMDNVPFAVRGPVDSPAEAIADRVFASLPVPDDEQCPEHFNPHSHEDNSATCRRIRFIEAPLFKHRNINAATHAKLNHLFGNANLTLFAHARRFVDYEMLVDEDGRNLYLTQENLRSYAALPIAFLHGEQNELFDVQSATRSYELYQSLHPDWAAQFAPAPVIIEGYGHVDVLIGKNADADVFPHVVEFFDKVMRQPDQGEAHEARKTELYGPGLTPQVRYPRVGPFLGHVRWSDDGKELLANVAFAVQSSSRTAIDAGQAGTTAWWFLPRQTTPQAMKIETFDRRISMAHGLVRIPSERVEKMGDSLRIQLAVLHDTALSDRQTITRHELIRAMREQRRDFRKHQLAAAMPIPKSVSRRWASYPGNPSNFAGDEAIWRRPVIIRRNVVDALERPGDESTAYTSQTRSAQAFSFALGTCRYPGIGLDRLRADATLGKILQLFATGPGDIQPLASDLDTPDKALRAYEHQLAANTTPPELQEPPAMMVMLGDQIYADATAGLLDPATPTERFTERYDYAFGLHNSPKMARLLRSLPVLMTPDDHEFRNGWPHEGPIMKTGDEQLAINTAQTMLHAYQSLTNPLGKPGSYMVDIGPCRFCVLDTRSARSTDGDGKDELIPAAVMDELAQWIESSAERFLCICTGTVILPRLHEDTSPANPVAVNDGFERAESQRARIIDLCVNHAAGRFALISGDYHVASAVQIHRAGNPEAVGCALVVPPLYAPFRYINSLPHELMQTDQIETTEHILDIRPSRQAGLEVSPQEGSGYAIAQLKRKANCWQFEVFMQLNQYEAHTGWQALKPVTRIELTT